jgi:lysophospholipase L1-like esterase
VPEQMRPIVRAASARLRRAQTTTALDEGARVADVDGETAAAFAGDAELFSADRFHPSSEGYARIAAALRPVVLAAAAEVPT